MAKGSFILYDADLKGIEFLTDAQTGKLFKALLKFRLEGTVPSLGNNAALNILFQQITEHITINEDKYKATCEKKSEAMKKRWGNGSNNTIENNRTLYSSIDKGGSLGDSDNDNVNENENVNDNVIDNDNDACGAKRENKRKNYYAGNNSYGGKYNNYKPYVPTLLRDNPSYDIELFKNKIVGLNKKKPEDST